MRVIDLGFQFHKHLSRKIEENIELRRQREAKIVLDVATNLMQKVPVDETAVFELITHELPKGAKDESCDEPSQKNLIKELVRGALDFTTHQHKEGTHCVSALILLGEGAMSKKANVDLLKHAMTVLNKAWEGITEISYKVQTGDQLCFRFRFL